MADDLREGVDFEWVQSKGSNARTRRIFGKKEKAERSAAASGKPTKPAPRPRESAKPAPNTSRASSAPPARPAPKAPTPPKPRPANLKTPRADRDQQSGPRASTAPARAMQEDRATRIAKPAAPNRRTKDDKVTPAKKPTKAQTPLQRLGEGIRRFREGQRNIKPK
jgi:translation initiation factor IF-2